MHKLSGATLSRRRRYRPQTNRSVANLRRRSATDSGKRSPGCTSSATRSRQPAPGRPRHPWPLADSVNGLTVDGIIGPETLASLDMTSGGVTASAPAVQGRPPPWRQLPMHECQKQSSATCGPTTSRTTPWRSPPARAAFVRSDRAQRACYGLFQIHLAAHRADWLSRHRHQQRRRYFDARQLHA